MIYERRRERTSEINHEVTWKLAMPAWSRVEQRLSRDSSRDTISQSAQSAGSPQIALQVIGEQTFAIHCQNHVQDQRC